MLTLHMVDHTQTSSSHAFTGADSSGCVYASEESLWRSLKTAPASGAAAPGEYEASPGVPPPGEPYGGWYKGSGTRLLGQHSVHMCAHECGSAWRRGDDYGHDGIAVGVSIDWTDEGADAGFLVVCRRVLGEGGAYIGRRAGRVWVSLGYRHQELARIPFVLCTLTGVVFFKSDKVGSSWHNASLRFTLHACSLCNQCLWPIN